IKHLQNQILTIKQALIPVRLLTLPGQLHRRRPAACRIYASSPPGWYGEYAAVPPPGPPHSWLRPAPAELAIAPTPPSAPSDPTPRAADRCGPAPAHRPARHSLRLPRAVAADPRGYPRHSGIYAAARQPR